MVFLFALFPMISFASPLENVWDTLFPTTRAISRSEVQNLLQNSSEKSIMHIQTYKGCEPAFVTLGTKVWLSMTAQKTEKKTCSVAVHPGNKISVSFSNKTVLVAPMSSRAVVGDIKYNLAIGEIDGHNVLMVAYDENGTISYAIYTVYDLNDNVVDSYLQDEWDTWKDSIRYCVIAPVYQQSMCD